MLRKLRRALFCCDFWYSRGHAGMQYYDRRSSIVRSFYIGTFGIKVFTTYDPYYVQVKGEQYDMVD